MIHMILIESNGPALGITSQDMLRNKIVEMFERAAHVQVVANIGLKPPVDVNLSGGVRELGYREVSAGLGKDF